MQKSIFDGRTRPFPLTENTADRILNDWRRDLPESHHSDECLLRAHRQIDSIQKMFDNLEKMDTNKDPRKTEINHRENLHRKASDVVKRLASETLVTKEALQGRRYELRREIDEAVGIAPRANDAELRTVIRGMSQSEKLKLISEAIDKKDVELLSAFFHESHHVALGLNAEQLLNYRKAAETRYAPDLLQLDAALVEADATLNKAFSESFNLADSVKLTKQEIARIEAAELAEKSVQ